MPKATIIITAQKYRVNQADPNHHVYKASVTFLEPGKNLRGYVTSVLARPSVEEVVRTLHYETLRKWVLICAEHPLSRLDDFIYQPLADRERLFEIDEQRFAGLWDENWPVSDSSTLRTSRQNVMAGTGGQEQVHSTQPVNTFQPSFGPSTVGYHGNDLNFGAGPSMAGSHGNDMHFGAGPSDAHGSHDYAQSGQYCPSQVNQNLNNGLQDFYPGPPSDSMDTATAGPETRYYMSGALPAVDAGLQYSDPGQSSIH